MGSPESFEGYHQHTITLSPPKTGKEIIDAVRSAVEDYGCGDKHKEKCQFIQRYLRGRSPAFVVGGASKMEPRNFVILTGTNLDKKRIEPDTLYGEIAVGTNNWPSIREEVFGYHQNFFINEVESFSSRVEEILIGVR